MTRILRYATHAALILAIAGCLASGTAPAGAQPTSHASHAPRAAQPAQTAPADKAVAVTTAVTAAAPKPRPRLFRGYGFDTCTAPPLPTMSAWREHSRYQAVGIYFGGRARGCAQPELTPAWVRSVDKAGWRLLPLYMGSQARCVVADHKRRYRMGAEHPARTGSAEAEDAVRRAQALGIAPSSPLYLDMEHYDLRDRTCTAQVLAYVQAWSRTVRAHGYLAGFYSSALSGVRHLAAAQRAGEPDLPDVMWFGRWSGDPTLSDSVLGSRQWHPHRRVHQYNGNVRERHGGRTMAIDRNFVDAPVAVVTAPKRKP